MHLRGGTEEMPDPEGRGFTTLAELRDAVLHTARDLLLRDVRDGVMELDSRIDAEHGAGSIAYTLPFRQAVNIIAEGAVLPPARVA
jgi:hypothetical protein